ncbi:uncharacterized protein DS421_9g262750 [Arachis hypogaea]|nr:uncharacterized protein DS421_9g262750 [Arachis hypogaea]
MQRNHKIPHPKPIGSQVTPAIQRRTLKTQNSSPIAIRLHHSPPRPSSSTPHIQNPEAHNGALRKPEKPFIAAVRPRHRPPRPSSSMPHIQNPEAHNGNSAAHIKNPEKSSPAAVRPRHPSSTMALIYNTAFLSFQAHLCHRHLSTSTTPMTYLRFGLF